MILEDIRDKTSKNHARLEQTSLLLPIGNKTITKETYIEILKKFYGYFHPLEQLVDNFPQIHTFLPDYTARRKANLIYQDLMRVTSANSQLPVELCEDLPAVTNPSQAFGCLYVMEGSTLGGKMIAKILKDVLHIDPDAGASFFNGYGKETGSKWKSFQQGLVNFSSVTSTNQEIIEAANETFAKFEKWINKE
jgi:heme oxygenase (biliverdin-IX-beta and delta-forming)